MRPTFSIICFTVLSGAGYGLWFLLGLALATHWPCGEGWSASVPPGTTRLCVIPTVLDYSYVIGFVLVAAGLFASLGHLGQPRRAWRALSQWRSSWLSREGVAALSTFAPAALLLAQRLAEWRSMTAVALDPTSELQWWNGRWWIDLGAPMLGAVLALGALLTVICTANIYASLKPIRAWRDRHVVPGYLLLGLYGGGLLLWAADSLPGWAMERGDRRVLLAGLITLALACMWLKRRYWHAIDQQPAPDAGHATGLAALGTVRSFEQPHTEDNYLTHEMGFVLARKHARKLRAIALLIGFLVPALLAVLALALPATRSFAAWPALACGLAGTFVERWLFFAEARHTVIAYYGR